MSEEPQVLMSLSGEEPQMPMGTLGEVPGAPRLSARKAAVVIAAVMAATGVLLGLVWAWLAPPVHGVVALTRTDKRVHAFLGDEADHFFVAAAIFVGLLTILAVVSAVLVWQWRAHRGPVALSGLWVGAVLAAGSAAAVGAAVAHWRYGSVIYDAAPVSPDSRIYYFTEAPAVFFGHGPLQMAATMLLPAALAAIVYSLLAVATPRDDLGGWPPVEDRLPLIPVTAVPPTA